ncbi:MAG: hypothetical protein R3Y13_03850 [bacterium]
MKYAIRKVMNSITEQGFEAYIVGGYVRDKLLRKNSYDIDICTSATPLDLVKIFGKQTINKYGGLSFKIGKYDFDITTYRIDGKYELGKLQDVSFTNSLSIDLERRDFTVNTICMNKNGKIQYYFDAKKDLKNRKIKLVNNDISSLSDDPLRILRAIRFCTLLNFSMDENLKLLIQNNVDLLNNLSKEKIKSEFTKILLSDNYVYGLKLIEELNIAKFLSVKTTNIKKSNDLLVMFAQIELNEEYFTKYETRRIKTIKNIINYGKIDNAILFENGLYFSVSVGEILGYKTKDIYVMFDEMWINENKPLCISGEDVKEIMNIDSGEIVGNILEELKQEILNKKLKNEKESIEQYLRRRK